MLSLEGFKKLNNTVIWYFVLLLWTIVCSINFNYVVPYMEIYTIVTAVLIILMGECTIIHDFYEHLWIVLLKDKMPKDARDIIMKVCSIIFTTLFILSLVIDFAIVHIIDIYNIDINSVKCYFVYIIIKILLLLIILFFGSENMVGVDK